MDPGHTLRDARVTGRMTQLKAEQRPGFGVDRTLIVRQLRLTPEERLNLAAANSNNLANLLRQAGRARPR
jgi:hypothetical protein